MFFQLIFSQALDIQADIYFNNQDKTVGFSAEKVKKADEHKWFLCSFNSPLLEKKFYGVAELRYTMPYGKSLLNKEIACRHEESF
jgi:hypothetical protein